MCGSRTIFSFSVVNINVGDGQRCVCVFVHRVRLHNHLLLWLLLKYDGISANNLLQLEKVLVDKRLLLIFYVWLPRYTYVCITSGYGSHINQQILSVSLNIIPLRIDWFLRHRRIIIVGWIAGMVDTIFAVVEIL